MRLALPFIILGCLLAAAGAELIYRPAGLITVGVLSIAVGVLLIDDGRRRPRT